MASQIYELPVLGEISDLSHRSPFTGAAFTGLLKANDISISMDGRCSYNENLFIERLWRTVKYEEVCLKAYVDGREAKISLGEYFSFYNTSQPHKSLGYRTLAEVYTGTMENTCTNVVESVVTTTAGIAGLSLNKAPISSY